MRGFGQKFIQWIKEILESGQTCISFKGQLGNYFNCKRGLRQGDSLSPFLFNLVTDSLSKILNVLCNREILRGLGNFNVGQCVLNLNFADDTLIFLQADLQMIEALKILLIGFENLSGLKINFSKSEIVPLNLIEEEGQQIAAILGCKLVSLPITYLGLPLHWKKLGINDWNILIGKMEKKLDCWKGKLLSICGRVILLKFVLCDMPIYWLSIFRVPNKVKRRI